MTERPPIIAPTVASQRRYRTARSVQCASTPHASQRHLSPIGGFLRALAALRPSGRLAALVLVCARSCCSAESHQTLSRSARLRRCKRRRLGRRGSRCHWNVAVGCRQPELRPSAQSRLCSACRYMDPPWYRCGEPSRLKAIEVMTGLHVGSLSVAPATKSTRFLGPGRGESVRRSRGRRRDTGSDGPSPEGRAPREDGACVVCPGHSLAQHMPLSGPGPAATAALARRRLPRAETVARAGAAARRLGPGGPESAQCQPLAGARS